MQKETLPDRRLQQGCVLTMRRQEVVAAAEVEGLGGLAEPAEGVFNGLPLAAVLQRL